MRVEFRDFHGLESYLVMKGYKKYETRKYRNEDFAFWKSFDITYEEDDDKEIGYQIGLLFYDTSKYDIPDNMHYGIQFEFVGGSKVPFDRVDFTISDDITIYKFEEVCEKLYQMLKEVSRDTDPKLLES